MSAAMTAPDLKPTGAAGLQGLVLPTTPESLWPLVQQAMQGTPDPRARTLLLGLTECLHRFVLAHAVTEAEFEQALDFVVRLGQATGQNTNEVVLAADLLGLSTLVALINNRPLKGHSEAALLGPFWRANVPFYPLGTSIDQAQGDAPEASRDPARGMPLQVSGRVFGADGQPLAEAVGDVWQASPVGLYENQDPSQPDMNLRGRFLTDAQGRYHFRSLRPAGYPVPTDGPCGELLRLQQRHPHRPAHLHFMVSAPGHKVLVSQVFADDAATLGSDPVFGVTEGLVGHFKTVLQQGLEQAELAQDFHLLPGVPVFPAPPIP